MCERIGETRLASWIEPALALIATDLNEDEAAERYAREGLRRGQSLGQVALHGYSLHAMGYWHMRRLEWEDAVHYYQQLLTLLRPTENRIIFLYSQAYAAEAFLGSGLVAESMKLIDEAIDLAEFAQAAYLRALSRRVQAQVFAKLERQEKAATAFEEAIADLDRSGSRLELGRAHYHRAEMLFEGGDSEQSRVDAERALQILTGCSARRDAQRAENLLAQLK
jgi:tetratricopeptide (TPR) repeat protein